MSSTSNGSRLVHMARELPHAHTPTALVVADEWFSAHGGISTVNRHLCGALAGAGAYVHCLVPNASAEERADAALLGVRLVEARPMPGAPPAFSLMQKPDMAGGDAPDVIIGHGRVTGLPAKFLAENHFRGAARLHLVHVTPDETEWWRPDHADDAGARAEERAMVELALGRDATRVVAVGPRLHQRLERDLHVFPHAAPPLRLDPGFDGVVTTRRGPAPGGPLQVLVLGRTEDVEIKGIDLAAKMLARALDLRGPEEAEVELLVRGAPPGECSALRERLRGWAAQPALHVNVRPFTTNAGRLQEDLTRAHLVLMPSRTEGFGLAGAEAIAMGVPALISSRSGLGMLLREILPPADAARVVVPMTLNENEDITRWSAHVAAILRDPKGAFATACAVRKTAARRRTWAMAADRLLHAIRPRSTAC